jgi:hypothetical protein
MLCPAQAYVEAAGQFRQAAFTLLISFQKFSTQII